MITLGFLLNLQTTHANSRMWNGSNSTEVIPHHAHLRIFNTAQPGVEFVGSGVLISERYVLTVAFNLQGFNSWSAGLGSTNFADLTWFSATGAIIHEGYNPSIANNNLGVIVFGNSITLSAGLIMPAVLPALQQQLPIASTNGRLSGFGFTTPDWEGPQSDHLLVATQTVVPQLLCENFFPELGPTLDGNFCAVDGNDYATPCGGEQGAGFEQNGIVVGLFSVTQGPCDVDETISYYLRFFNYRQWILDHTGI